MACKPVIPTGRRLIDGKSGPFPGNGRFTSENRAEMMKKAFFREKKAKKCIFLRKKLDKWPFALYLIKSSIFGEGFLCPVNHVWRYKEVVKHGALHPRLH